MEQPPGGPGAALVAGLPPGAVAYPPIATKPQPTRYLCPYPGCNRSFRDFWRLKVHYRAQPGARGSGVERGHGVELPHCPLCHQDLQQVKYHKCSAGPAAAASAPTRPAGRSATASAAGTSSAGTQQLQGLGIVPAGLPLAAAAATGPAPRSSVAGPLGAAAPGLCGAPASVAGGLAGLPHPGSLMPAQQQVLPGLPGGAGGYAAAPGRLHVPTASRVPAGLPAPQQAGAAAAAHALAGQWWAPSVSSAADLHHHHYQMPAGSPPAGSLAAGQLGAVQPLTLLQPAGRHGLAPDSAAAPTLPKAPALAVAGAFGGSAAFAGSSGCSSGGLPGYRHLPIGQTWHPTGSAPAAAAAAARYSYAGGTAVSSYSGSTATHWNPAAAAAAAHASASSLAAAHKTPLGGGGLSYGSGAPALATDAVVATLQQAGAAGALLLPRGAAPAAQSASGKQQLPPFTPQIITGFRAALRDLRARASAAATGGGTAPPGRGDPGSSGGSRGSRPLLPAGNSGSSCGSSPAGAGTPKAGFVDVTSAATAAGTLHGARQPGSDGGSGSGGGSAQPGCRQGSSQPAAGSSRGGGGEGICSDSSDSGDGAARPAGGTKRPAGQVPCAEAQAAKRQAPGAPPEWPTAAAAPRLEGSGGSGGVVRAPSSSWTDTPPPPEAPEALLELAAHVESEVAGAGGGGALGGSCAGWPPPVWGAEEDPRVTQATALMRAALDEAQRRGMHDTSPLIERLLEVLDEHIRALGDEGSPVAAAGATAAGGACSAPQLPHAQWQHPGSGSATAAAAPPPAGARPVAAAEPLAPEEGQGSAPRDRAPCAAAGEAADARAPPGLASGEAAGRVHVLSAGDGLRGWPAQQQQQQQHPQGALAAAAGGLVSLPAGGQQAAPSVGAAGEPAPAPGARHEPSAALASGSGHGACTTGLAPPVRGPPDAPTAAAHTVAHG